jgi:hypothetical protein
MVFDTTSMLQLNGVLTWTCFAAAPDDRKYPYFTQVLTNQLVLEQLLSSLSLSFAPGLYEALSSATPPTIGFFKATPTNVSMRWAVYVLVLEKPGSPTLIYIGSGTETLLGVSSRLREYSKFDALPARAQDAIKSGYTITHKVLLLWIPIPQPTLHFPSRVLMVAMEAALTSVFRALHPSS